MIASSLSLSGCYVRCRLRDERIVEETIPCSSLTRCRIRKGSMSYLKVVSYLRTLVIKAYREGQTTHNIDHHTHSNHQSRPHTVDGGEINSLLFGIMI